MFEDSKEKKSSNTASDIKNVIKISLFGQFQYSDFILLEEMLGLRPHSPLTAGPGEVCVLVVSLLRRKIYLRPQ